LQHYRLQRDVEILVVDEQRRFGNGRLLPAGPLREPLARSKSVDLCVMSRRLESEHSGATASNPSAGHSGIVAVASLKHAHNMRNESIVALDHFRGSYVHAVAAIGHPAAFFDALRARGLEVREHAFRDHAELSESDITFADDAPVLMTQKDAVKCRAFASERHWSVPLELKLGASDTQLIKGMIERILRFRGRSVATEY
jgi:tetraacyldisaccharide 4'-kinase